MKVLGFVGERRDSYICEVSHSEIEKFLGMYYGRKDKLNIGDEVNLGCGYDHESKINSGVKKMEDLIQSSIEITEAISQGKKLVRRMNKES